MTKSLDKGQFWDLFKNRAVVVADLPPGRGRDLAERVNQAEGRGDEFFDQDMHLVEVTGWPEEHLEPEEPVEAPDGARLAIWPTDPRDTRHIPPPDEDGILYATTAFSLMNSGNRTLRVPKRSWKVEFESRGGDDRLVGMSRLNLKAMYNDPSQMREALAWRLFDTVGIPSPRHTYGKLAINGRYRGLFSLIEQVDGRFLKDHFGKNDKGNLYKAYCGDLGCATLEHRVDGGGDDSGRQYRSPADSDDATYRLKTNEDDQAANAHEDLAALIRTINGVGLQWGDGRFDADEFRDTVERIMNAKAFLRWAGANLLLGGWDNYFATPANYYLYNSGHQGDEDGFVGSPYFTFIPWDYDNSFGIDYFDTRWQYTDIVDWPSNTMNYHRSNPPGRTSRIPLVQNLLHNRELLRYYLDHLEHLLDTRFNPESIMAEIGTDGGGRLWDRVSHAAYLESDTPHGQAFTGRQFSNDEVFRSGCVQNELRRGNATVEGIHHYVRMRYDSARSQLAALRATHPAGASGATFSGMMEALPARR